MARLFGATEEEVVVKLTLDVLRAILGSGVTFCDGGACRQPEKTNTYFVMSTLD